MTILLRILLRLWALLPLPVVHLFASGIGWVAQYLPFSIVRVARLNLNLSLPELPARERDQLCARSLRHMFKAVVEMPAIWFGSRTRLEHWMAQDDARQKLRQALSSERGAIVLCPHVGCWELAGMFCASVGTITSLYKPQNGPIDRLILEGRQRLGAQLVPTDGSGVRALLQALRRGEMVGILPDHDPPWGSGVFAPLFGVPAHTSDLVPKLAAKTGAAVWFCYAERLPWGRGFRFHVVPGPAGIDDPARGTEALNRGIEAVITHLPEQYWWGYKRFRRQPPGERNPYRRAKR